VFVQNTLNDFDLLTYFNAGFGFTHRELVARRKKSTASSRRNMGYYGASQAMNIRGRANQIQWHPGIKGFFTGAHEDPRDAAGIEIPEDMSAAMIEAWDSEGDPDQAVLMEFAASLHAVTGIPFGDHSVLHADMDWEPFTFSDRAAAGAKVRGGGGSEGSAKRRRKWPGDSRSTPPFLLLPQAHSVPRCHRALIWVICAPLGSHFEIAIQLARCVCSQNFRLMTWKVGRGLSTHEWTLVRENPKPPFWTRLRANEREVTS